MNIQVKTSLGGYDIILKRSALNEVEKYLDLNRKVLIVTDNGVPTEYAKSVAEKAKQPLVVTIEQGEQSKNLDTYKMLLEKAVDFGLTRSDCIVAVGGGVVGDISGFVASTFMRGIDFYNIPTTLLSQVDSSIGGKTAIDFMGYKNIVGAFWQPKAVVIDSDTLETLPQRQFSNGLAEAIKMSLTSDSELFEIFEQHDPKSVIDTIIHRSLLIKKRVVEEDERENGLRKVLNFGHTVAHAIESENDMANYYHGECVAMGMLFMCSQKVRNRLLPVLEKLSLPTFSNFNTEKLLSAIKHDKKFAGDKVTVIFVEEVGDFQFKEMTMDDIENILNEVK